jgi:hypothetical protein
MWSPAGTSRSEGYDILRHRRSRTGFGVGRHENWTRGAPFAGLIEKIMSKSSDVSTLDHRPLADSELNAVTRGWFVSCQTGQTVKMDTRWPEKRRVPITKG